MRLFYIVLIVVCSTLSLKSEKTGDKIERCGNIRFDISAFSTTKAETNKDIEGVVSLVEALNTSLMIGRSYALVQRIEKEIKRNERFPVLKEAWSDLNTSEIYESIKDGLDYKFYEGPDVWIVEYCHSDLELVKELLHAYGDEYMEFYSELAEVNDWRVKNIPLLKTQDEENGEQDDGGDRNS